MATTITTTPADSPDFVAILAEGIITASYPAYRKRDAEAQLAARITAACPTCNGTGRRLHRAICICQPADTEGIRHSVRCNLARTDEPCDHVDAPTIGDALAQWWAAR